MSLANQVFSAPFTSLMNSTLAATDVSARVSVDTAGQGNVVLVQNEGTKTAYLQAGNSTVTATAGGTTTAANIGSQPILAGAIMSLLIAPGCTHIAGVCDAGNTAILRFSRGVGL